MKKQGLALVMLSALALVGCGSSPQQDASNLLSGMGGSLGSTGSNKAYTVSGGAAPASNVIQEIHNHLEGAAWLGALNSDQAVSSGSPQTSAATPWTSCPTQSITSGGTSCSVSCPSSSQLKIACSSTDTSTGNCNGTSYAISNPNYSVTIDVTNVTGTGTSATGSLTMGLSFNANIKGGSFSGGALNCSMNFSVDISQLRAGTASLAPNCDDGSFSCTYSGTTLSCSDIKSKMASDKLSCS